jgi:tetratricopeptide (TPR) repeat protein
VTSKRKGGEIGEGSMSSERQNPGKPELPTHAAGNADVQRGAGTRPRAQSILALAQDGRFVIEDFVPLADSLEWELGQQYFRERGSKAFIGDAIPVPFAINNDGALSRRTAETFFASVVEAEREGPLEPTLYVLELGIGVGLFARFFLDAFQEICAGEGKDFYRRLSYIAADRSERMLADACRHGVFANHPGRYLVRVVDAQEPGRYLDDLVGPASRAGIFRLRAVFLNYLLDCLPAAHLKIQQAADGAASAEVLRLCVRTCLARHLPLGEFTRLTAEELSQRARSGSAADRRALMELYGLFASEYDYRSLDGGALPYLDFAVRVAREHKTTYLLHNYGAIQSLEGLLRLLHPRGFIAINDYGQVELKPAEEAKALAVFEHQRFSQSTAIGVNFPLLKAYFEAAGQWVEPGEEAGHIYSRLVGHAASLPDADGQAGSLSYGIGAETVRVFAERFGKSAWEAGQERWMLARANLQHGRVEAALTAYHQAIERQPGNWILLNEVAGFLTFTLRNPAAGVAMAKAAIELNPACSAVLWNTLGDAWFEMGKMPEAKGAYQRALRVNGADVQARYNLAWVYLNERRYQAALAVVAEALALDETGEYWERLVKKQNEILGRLQQRNQQKQFLLANRVSSKPGTLNGVDAKEGN